MERKNNGNYQEGGNHHYGNQYNNLNNNQQMNNNLNQNNSNYQMNNSNSNQNNNYQMNNNSSNQNNNYQMNNSNNNENNYMNFNNNEANDNYNSNNNVNNNYNGNNYSEQANQSNGYNVGAQYSEGDGEKEEKKKDPLMMAIYALAVVIAIGVIGGAIALLGGGSKKEPKEDNMASGLPPITQSVEPSLEPSASGEISESLEPTNSPLPNMTLTPITTGEPGPGQGQNPGQWMTFTPTYQPTPTHQPPEGPSGGLVDNIAPAPDFAVMDKNGGYTNLTTFRDNKPCVVYFWTSTTDASSDSLKEFNKMYFKHRMKVKFMMISVTGMNGESVDAAKDYIKDKRYDFPVYHDTSRGASGAYQVSTVPSTYFITKDGKVAYYKIGSISKHDLEDGIKKIK